MGQSLVFILAPLAALPPTAADLAALQAAQRCGPKGAFALRLFAAPELQSSALAGLPLDGQLDQRLEVPQRNCRRICDAVVPQFEPRLNWLGVYQQDADGDAYRCLDRFPLAEASNETCWFYPTHDGRFLSWERALAIALEPGVIVADAPQSGEGEGYARSRLTVLWSLLADDVSLTCVGLTYDGQRIDWRVAEIQPEPMATWSLFQVDGQSDPPLQIVDSHTVFAEPPV